MSAAVPDFIQALDDADPLHPFRGRFALPPDIVYLDGNSLGALPVETAPRLGKTVRAEWGKGLIRSWNSHDWVGAPRRVGDKIAALVGAEKGEVVVADSTSVNIFKLVMAMTFVRGLMARCWSQSRRVGPNQGWERSQFSKRGLPFLKQKSAMIMKTVEGRPGTK